MSRVKLTKAQRDYLRAMPDWSAVHEIRQRLGRVLTESGRCYDTIARMASRLVDAGLAEHHDGNRTWRITPAGRAALADGGGNG